MKTSLVAIATLSLASVSSAEGGFFGQRQDKRAPANHGQVLDDFDLAGRGLPQILPMDSLKIAKRESAAAKEKAALELASSKKAAAVASKSKSLSLSKSKSLSLSKSKSKATSIKKFSSSSLAKRVATTAHTTANTVAEAKAFTTSSRAAFTSSSKAASLAKYSASSIAAFNHRIAASATALAAQQAGQAYSSSSKAAATSAARFTTSSRAAYSSSSQAAASAAAASASAAASRAAASAAAKAAAAAFTTSSKAAAATAVASKVQYSASSALAAASAIASAYISQIAQIADGSYMQAGAINATFLWQASGQLSHNGCPPQVNISDCFTSYLNANGMWEETTKPARLMVRDAGDATSVDNSDSDSSSSSSAKDSSSSSSTTKSTTTPAASSTTKPAASSSTTTTSSKASSSTTKPAVASSSVTPASSTTTKAKTTTSAAAAATSSLRQRNEMYSWPPAAAGLTYLYNWKSFQDNSTTSAPTFFHQWQLFSRTADGPAVALNIQHGGVSIYDYIRDCSNGEGTQPNCPAAVPLSQFVGRTIAHQMLVTYGPSGSFSYQAWDTTSNSTAPLIDYEFQGDTGSNGSLKMGNYRIGFTGMVPATAYFGDYTAQLIVAGAAVPTASGWTTTAATATTTSYSDAMATDDSNDYKRRRRA